MNFVAELGKNSTKIVLFIAILIFFIAPYKKNIWYDESISILANKGITYDSDSIFENTTKINSRDIVKLNTFSNVFTATVRDNDNSFLYNIGLHYFTLLFGNQLKHYILFSRIFAIFSLIGLYYLGNMLWAKGSATCFGILFLLTDLTFWGMGNEIRAYSMGAFFVILSTIYALKFISNLQNSKYLFYFCLSALAAILTHFFCVYIIFVLCLFLLYKAKFGLFSIKNIAILFTPILLLGLFFILAKYQVSSNHIHTYVLGHQNENNFNLGGVAINFMKFTSLNFKIIFPRFKDTAMVATLSFFLIGFIYFLGNKLVKNNSEQTEKFNLFFILGIISSLFLAIMSINIKSYSPFYYRYFTFSIPFIALFLAHFIQIMSNKYNNKAITTAIFLMLFLPNAYFYVGFLIKNNTVVRYNHITIAQEIVSKNITNVELPEWEDAFLIQSFLPSGYDLDFTLNKTSPNFTLSNATIHEQFLVIKQKN